MFYLETNHVFSVESTWIRTQQLHILPECHVSLLHISLKLHIILQSPHNITEAPPTDES